MNYNQQMNLLELGIQNQYLISKCLDYNKFNFLLELQNIDQDISSLLWRKSKKFDFHSELAFSKTLLVGEGNLSFTLSLVKHHNIFPQNLVATTFEDYSELPDSAINNAQNLKILGAAVLCNIDATKLYNYFESNDFDNIIFQFPNVGSRESEEGHNPNHILLRDFLISSKQILKPNGQVIVTLVDSPYYNGSFQVDLAAEQADYRYPEPYKFKPSDFPEYKHLKTLEDESAIDNYKKFITWVFKQQ